MTRERSPIHKTSILTFTILQYLTGPIKPRKWELKYRERNLKIEGNILIIKRGFNNINYYREEFRWLDGFPCFVFRRHRRSGRERPDGFSLECWRPFLRPLKIQSNKVKKVQFISLKKFLERFNFGSFGKSHAWSCKTRCFLWNKFCYDYFGAIKD